MTSLRLETDAEKQTVTAVQTLSGLMRFISQTPGCA